jgi:glycosyltransferase involved in cell wall biosynthesis
VVVSELRRRELSDLLGIPDSRIKVIPNGIDAHPFLGLGEQTRRIVERLDLFSAEPLLLLPVRITPRKNIELALQVLAALTKFYPRSMLVVTGPPGPHNPNNEQYFNGLREMRANLNLEGRAFFLTELSAKPLPDDVIADLYRLADALFLPSREEGFGIPVLEAGLAGLPLFLADIQPLRSLAGECAVYFSPDASPERVAAKVVNRLASDPIISMRVQVRQNYSWDGIYRSSIAPLLEEIK